MDEWVFKPARDVGLSWRERIRSCRRESGLLESTMRVGWWWVMRRYMRIFHHLHVEGREYIPGRAPFVLAANHSSHLDALVLGSILPIGLRDIVFPIAAGDTFFESPITSTLTATFINALPLWREKTARHALDDLRERLVADPCGYILFPEGTRSRSGKMGPFKPGVGRLLAGTSVPAVPCHIEGAFQSWPAGDTGRCATRYDSGSASLSHSVTLPTTALDGCRSAGRFRRPWRNCGAGRPSRRAI